MFVSSELLVYFFFLFHNLHFNFIDTTLLIIAKTGLRTNIQAFGFLVLKKSRDPMEGI